MGTELSMRKTWPFFSFYILLKKNDDLSSIRSSLSLSLPLPHVQLQITRQRSCCPITERTVRLQFSVTTSGRRQRPSSSPWPTCRLRWRVTARKRTNLNTQCTFVFISIVCVTQQFIKLTKSLFMSLPDLVLCNVPWVALVISLPDLLRRCCWICDLLYISLFRLRIGKSS